MNKLTVTFAFLCCVVTMYGQKYKPCIIITKQGEQIECLADMKDDYLNYKVTPDSKKDKIYSSDVKYAAFIEGDSLELFSGMPVYKPLSKETTPTNVGWIQFITDPRTDPVSVYVYYYMFLGNLQKNFGCYRQGDDYGQDLISSGSIKKNKEAMTKYFADCPSLVEYIKGKHMLLMTIDDLKNIVQEYNQCDRKE